ncbi:MAG: YpdA family putative bacillithiol disulfide reductase [Ignavibacteria bacterium]|nr:YpdA family putative bacillithiol disulfide reductase [Ignavibacteria bacterium]MBI3766287.1 YpdA family putative bacillithiol disulfide reductase [Ignavibacteriales bacterium]
MNHSYDLVIIGAGPAGLACAIEAKKAGLRCRVLDKGSIVDSIQHFQRDMVFFSTPELLEIGDVPFIVPTTRPTALDCVNYYRSVADYHRLDCGFYQRVLSGEKRNGDFVLKTSRGDAYTARNLVAATGYYDCPNPLNVLGEKLPHVSHYYRDPLPFYGQDVLIVGGKNSAVEAALDLWRHGARVTVVHRGDTLSSGVKYWILPDFENRVADGAITLRLNSVVKEFQPGCTIVENKDGDLFDLKTNFAFILIGYLPDTSFLKSLGIEIDGESLAPVHNPETMETNAPNIFVAGGMVGGKFNNKVFIENGREHGKKIIASVSR